MELLNKKLKVVFLTGFLILTYTPVVLCITPPVVYVAGNGSGDFNCSGENDHIPINQALKFVTENPGYTTVYLKGPFTYVIDDTLLIGSNTILEGDSNVTVKLVRNAGWSSTKPLIKENTSSSHNITIQGFTIDGNREGNANIKSGDGYHNLMHLSDCQNVSVYDMHLINNHGDGLKTDNCSNITFCNNEAYLLGHDVLYASASSNVEAYNNRITCRTNSGLRLYNTNHAKLYDNIITSEGSGGVGIEIQRDKGSMDNIEVYNNTIYETALAGIWFFSQGLDSESATNVHIHHNRIYDTGTVSGNEVIGGILSVGFNAIIENNVIDGAYGAGIVQNDAFFSAPAGSGYTVTVRNNIITNTRTSAVGGNGSGICNKLTDTHAFILQNNSLYNNTGGNYMGIQDPLSDIIVDPQYADPDKHDYHLKSKSGRWNGSCWVNDNITSPCIDAGYPFSDYSKEPEPNGNRINIGMDGNTWYASKSEFEVLNNSSDNNGSSDDSDGHEGDESHGGHESHGSSGSGSGGAGGSPEPAKNVEVKELSQGFITNDKNIKFDFTRNATCIVYVGFYAKKTLGKTTTIVEMLKDKSTLVSELPSGEVYRSLNIWVGNGGIATSKNIENPVVCFKVEKSWIRDKNVDQSSIILNMYNDTKWDPLSTSLSGEDDMYLYFTAETPGFSSFVITGKMVEEEILAEILPQSDPQILEQNNGYIGSDVEKKPERAGNTKTENKKTENKKTGNASIFEKENKDLPGFEIISCIVCLLSVLLYRRK
ncbi:PGF-pre-PGF domain-containing protein [Methanosarcina sp.]|uniref:PGF-pre-PGF domain-containing protein n=1 Tax=Methanosarcina sp. TaxID=2213 RepID=UPI002988C026|nr:PGF-pre-PGF domain-containing protein [Methanosarcina sp.]MDW5549932.1 PGF-pre-PGF domain-containing protein [Methanosarcina sp.]MDW5552536.1 PGF-pre-PGF domain-containing protein [Methanosarcina sp.]MDW5560265.1 PGF-pre-PGF domain-containing protein [Methanosarcina sp.]